MEMLIKVDNSDKNSVKNNSDKKNKFGREVFAKSECKHRGQFSDNGLDNIYWGYRNSFDL